MRVKEGLTIILIFLGVNSMNHLTAFIVALTVGLSGIVLSIIHISNQ